MRNIPRQITIAENLAISGAIDILKQPHLQYSASMNRTLANIIIDIIAAFLFLGMLATGHLLRFPLPPGGNKTLSLWGYTRHQWGDVHFWISVGLLLVLVIHLVLHWSWIVTVIGKRCHLLPLYVGLRRDATQPTRLALGKQRKANGLRGKKRWT